MKSNDEFNIFGTIKNGQRLRTGDDRFSSIVFSYATCSHVSVTVTIFRTFVIPKRDELANTGSAMKSVLELISGISNGVNAFTCSPTSLYRLRTVIIFGNDKRFHWYRAVPIIPLDSTFAFIFSLSCISDSSANEKNKLSNIIMHIMTVNKLGNRNCNGFYFTPSSSGIFF